MPRIVRPYPRILAPRLREALADTPAILVHGPRQSGKTTLARGVGEPRGYRYVSFDDDAVLAAARHDPVGFVARLPAKSILDEVQRVPEIFQVLRSVIDEDRRSGRFLILGSASRDLIQQSSETLAGRIAFQPLTPFLLSEVSAMSKDRDSCALQHKEAPG